MYTHTDVAISHKLLATYQRLALCLVAVPVLLALPDLASAADNTEAISDALCRVVNVLQNKVGRAVSMIGIAFLGIGFFLGKISWGLAIAIGLGVAGIFNAGNIVNWISGNSTSTGC
jgi:type IV secretion system protein VirB2